MSDDEENRKESQPSKQGKKQTLAGATHLLKAEALKRLELKDVEEPNRTEESAGDGDGIEARPTSDKESKVQESVNEADLDSEDKTSEILGEERSGIKRPQSGEEGFKETSDGINNSSVTSDLGNANSEDIEESRPSASHDPRETDITETKDSSDKQEGISVEEKAGLQEDKTEGVKITTEETEKKTEKVLSQTGGESEIQGAAETKTEVTSDRSKGEVKEDSRGASETDDKKQAEENPSKSNLDKEQSSEGKDKSENEETSSEQQEKVGKMEDRTDGEQDITRKEEETVGKSDEDQGEKALEDAVDSKGIDGMMKSDIIEESVEANKDETSNTGVQRQDDDSLNEHKIVKDFADKKEPQNNERADMEEVPEVKNGEVNDTQRTKNDAADLEKKDGVIEEMTGSKTASKVESDATDKARDGDNVTGNDVSSDESKEDKSKANVGVVEGMAGPERSSKVESNATEKARDGNKVAGKDGSMDEYKVDESKAKEDMNSANETKDADKNEVGSSEEKDHPDDNAKIEEDGKNVETIDDNIGLKSENGKEIATKSSDADGDNGEDNEKVIDDSDEETHDDVSKEEDSQTEKENQEGKENELGKDGNKRTEKKSSDESTSAVQSKDLDQNEKVAQDSSDLGDNKKDTKEDSSEKVKPDEVSNRKPVNVVKNIEVSNEPEVRGEGIKLKKGKVEEKGKESPNENDKSGSDESANEAQADDAISPDNAEANDDDDSTSQPEEHIMPADFYYDQEEHVSKPFTTDGIPEKMLCLYHSFGFECTKRSNLHMLDEENMLFSAGNMVQILNINTNKLTYIRSTGGGGIGAIAVHPSRKYFAVAEKGIKPNIIIYEYPSLKLYRILRDGTELAYANLDFSPNGEKLASVGSAPDYMLTVWDWKNENIVLRTKAFSQEVYKIAFSPEDEGHLCSSGTGHIRFWKMANTFTGLKLQGELGRYGTTELTDIAGFVELPDGKVLSGSEWGNMLLWDGGLIKAEIARKGKKTCHLGMIEQFFLDEGELITIGADGFVKVWDFESIDTADAVDVSKIFEMEPMSELKVGSDVKLMSMVKSVNEHEVSIWYAQDAAGGIWKLDLSFSHTSQAPKKLFTYHAGAISGLAISPVTHLSATTGADHTVRLYDYLSKTQLCHSKFTAAGSCIIWMPKVVDSNGLSVLAGFADGVVRLFTVIKNGTNNPATKKNASNFDLKLSQVFKPHTQPVTSLAVSKDGKFLATGGEDSTVFFFSIDKMKCKAIGFIETGAPVVSLDWSSVQRKNQLLICCNDGSVLEISCPKPDKYDTSKTYLIPLPGLKRKEFKFISIKDKLVKAEEELRKAKEEEEKQKQLEEERRKRRARGIEEDEDEEENKEEDAEESETTPAEEEEEVYHEPGKIVKGFYKGESGEFWLLLDGWDAGYIYECGFPNQKEVNVDAEPLRAIKFDDIEDVPVMSHYFSKSGQYLALGLDNGAIRIQVLESHDLNTLNSYWRLNMHDNQSGAIMGISMSFDEKFLLSVGKDGNFFVYSFMDEKKVMEMIGKQRAEVAAKADSSTLLKIDDIEDPNHYSIELEKQKAEHDKMVRLAEEKKQQIRQTVNLLRIEYKKLAARNQEMPSYLQLPPTDFIIDPEMESDIAKETEKKLALVEREMAWESEKHSLALKKLETRFKDMIECERFTLRAFNTSHKIFSYRATVLPPEFTEVLEVTKNRTKITENETMPLFGGKRLSFMTKKTRALSKDESTNEDVEALQTKKAKPAQNLDEKVAKAIEKAEQKKKRRQARQAEWDEFYRSKPDQNKEDPLDLAAIKEAQDNMGDFKLKTAKDYIVPEKQRVNAEKKRVQLMELKEHIHQLKQSFNEKLLSLRNKKIAVIDEVKILVAELEAVQNGLPSSMHVAIPQIPTMHADEQPEKLYEYTKDILMKFKEKMDESSNQILKSENTGGGFGGGFGGFGGGETQQNTSKLTSQMASTRTEQRGRSTSILSTLSSQPRSISSLPPDRGSPDAIREEQLINLEPSDMELKVRDEQRLRLLYKRDMLMRKIRELLIAFDAELRTLRHEKIHLDVDLKNADLRIITLFEELVLLKEFEKRENMLMGKVVTKSQEKEDMQDKVEDCEMKLQSKKEEIDHLQERDKALYTTFSSTVGESNKFEAFLIKVFKKKIKRVKKTEQNAGSDEESDDDFSDDDYDSEEDEDSETEELDDSVCPPGCDQAIFDQVCQLREKRLDLEEATAEEKKAAEALKKELDALQKKAKIIDTALMTAEADLEAFQREKQQKLNELDVVVTLKLNQLQYLNNSTVPQDLLQSLVFTSSSLERLQRRIKELEKEKSEQKKLYWQRRQQHVQLIRDKKSTEDKIAQLEEKVKQMQLLKFGRLVNLEKLETVSVNKLAEEIKEQLRTQEFASAKEIASWEKRIDEAKAKLTQVTRENTRRLDTYTVLLQEQKELEGQLDSRQKNLGGEFQGNRKADYQERQRLIQLAQLQSQEIEALKEEIGLLSRKGGHILPPSQAPVPQAPTAR